MSEKLAVDGGTPVRTETMPPPYPGGLMIGEAERQAVLDVIERRSPFRYYGPDPAGKVQALEQHLAETVGTEHALAVSSGTASLVVGLRALGVGMGDEVIVPAITFVASALAVIACNAVPIFADVDDSFSLDPQDVAERITECTKAIMPVHFRGVACDMDALMAVADRHGIPLLEDCAQSFGSKWQGKYVGSFGAINAFSFQLNKVITGGEGGAVTTNDARLYERAVRAHDQGSFRTGQGEIPEFCGENYRMSELNGALVGAQLKRLSEIVEPMQQAKRHLRAAIEGLPNITLREVPDPEGDTGNSLTILLPSAAAREQFQHAIQAEGIPFQNPYGGRPVYMIDRLRYKRTWDGQGIGFQHHPDGLEPYAAGLCPRAEDLLSRALGLSITPIWSGREVEDTIVALEKVAHALAAQPTS